MKVAIITADIVQSTAILPDAKQELYAAIAAMLEEISRLYTTKSEWYRGDSFQVQASAKDAARIALLIKTGIRGIDKSKGARGTKVHDVRLAAGIGTIDYIQETLAQSDGEAFRLSGRMLDQLKSLKQTFSFTTADSHNAALAIESQLLDALLAGTTATQCRVLYQKMMGLKEEEIAKKIVVSQSAINQHSNAAHWNVLSNYLDYFETLYHE